MERFVSRPRTYEVKRGQAGCQERADVPGRVCHASLGPLPRLQLDIGARRFLLDGAASRLLRSSESGPALDCSDRPNWARSPIQNTVQGHVSRLADREVFAPVRRGETLPRAENPRTTEPFRAPAQPGRSWHMDCRVIRSAGQRGRVPTQPSLPSPRDFTPPFVSTRRSGSVVRSATFL